MSESSLKEQAAQKPKKPSKPIRFEIGYQYVSGRLAESIFKHVTDDFILPAYLQRCQSKEKQKPGQQSQNVLDYQIIDYKILKKINEKQLDLLLHDRQYLLRIKDSSLIKIWEAGLQKIRQILKTSSNVSLNKSIQGKEYVQSILFESKQEKFILLRFPQKILNVNQDTAQQNGQSQHLKEYMVKEKQRSEFDFIINIGESPKAHKISIQSYCKSIQITKQGFVKVDENNLIDPKVQLLMFTIQGMQELIDIPFQEQVFLQCQVLDYTNIKDKDEINYFFKGYKFQQDKQFGSKHYDLAFQGGGAKGLAYVGAYKALKEKRIDNKQIQIGSIMGSSAGGIIAIAASTGISYRQIEQLCYKMDNISREDRITNKDPAYDQYGNKITFNGVETKLKEILKQFGILNQENSSQIIQNIKKKIDENGIKLINYLKIVAPNISDIFENGIIQKTQVGYIWDTTTKKQLINWDGIILHGALMKGEAIHNLAAECLVKYLLKQSYNQKFGQKLQDAFIIINSEDQEEKIQNSKDIIYLLERFKQNNLKILNTPLRVLVNNQNEQQNIQDKLNQFAIFLVNKVMVLMNEYLEDTRQKLDISSLIITKKLNYSSRFLYKKTKLLKIIKKIKDKNLQNNLHHQINFLQNNSQNKLTIDYIQVLKKKQQEFHKTIKNVYNYLNEGKFNLINEPESLAYYFKFMYFYTQFQQELQTKTQQAQQQKIQQKLRKFQNINRILSCETYSQLNSQVNLVNLLNHKHFELQKGHQNQNIIQYISQMFKGSYTKQSFTFTREHIKDLICLNRSKQESSAKYKKRSLIFQLCDHMSKHLKERSTCLNGLLAEKQSTYTILIRNVSKITMKQYYNINPIEFTCTSVDLDNKILRFFNHKTTPNLPICRAVQMTGSFPVAFKALKWKQQWGFYYVHHKDKKIAINITGHQFTDGGLLANFPIRYLDNKTIRKCYFSHAQQKQNSILLGFGLDQLKDGQFQKDKNETKEEYIKKNKIYQAQQSFDMFSTWQKIRQGVKFYVNSKKSDLTQQQWGNFNIKLLEQIPILRFLTKIVSAYPNADRNLNLQAFSQQIMTHKPNDIHTINIHEMIQMNANDKEKQKKIKQYQWKSKIQRYFKQFQLFKNVILINKTSSQREQQIEREKLRKVKEKQQGQKFKKQQQELKKKDIKNKLEKLYKQSTYSASTIPDQSYESQMSQILIKILHITLKTNNNTNKIIREILSNRYVYLNFIGKRLQKQKQQLRNISITQEIRQIQQKFNKNNLLNFYQKKNFEEIQKHGDFYQFQKNYYEKYASKLDIDESIKEIKSRQQNNNHENIQNQIKKIQKEYKKNKQQAWNTIILQKGNLKHNLFDVQVKDITFSQKRLIEYLYLQIKGQQIIDNQKILQNQGLKSEQNKGLKQIIQKNYKKLFYLNNEEKNTNFHDLIHPKIKNYMKFDEILNFLYLLKDKGVKHKDGKTYKIQYQWQFTHFLEKLKEKDREGMEFQMKLLNFDLYTQNIELRFLKSGTQSNQEIKQKIQQKYTRQSQSILLSQQINEHYIQKMQKKDIRNKLKESLIFETSQIQQQNFVKFLTNNLKFKSFITISVEKDTQIRKLRYQAKKCFKNLIFGEKLEKDEIINQRITNFKSKIRQFKQKLLNQNQNQVRYFIFSKINFDLLKYLQYKVISNYFEKKKQQQKQFLMYHKAYIKDIQYFFAFLRSLTLILLDHQNLNLLSRIFKTYQSIFEQFLEEYKKFIDAPQNQVTIQRLNQVFLIKYQHLSDIVSILRKITISTTEFQNQMQNICKLVTNFNSYKICLPLFAEDWQHLIRTNYLLFFTKYRKYYLKDTNYKKYQRIISSILENKRNRKLLRNIYKKGQKAKNLHLIIQGAATSNQIFCAYYDQIINSSFKKQQKQKIEKADFKINMITTSSLFGFLLCLEQGFDQTRKDMYLTRNYSLEMFNPEKIKQFYQKCGVNISLNDYNVVVADYHKIQLLDIMKIFQKEYQKQTGKISYLKKFNDIRLMVEEQQQYYNETCNQILNKAAQQISKIQNNFLDSQKANEIAKKFGYDYTCNFQNRHKQDKQHKYSQQNKKCKQTFIKMMSEYYQQFGSIISAITCSFITNKIPFAIDLNKIQSFTKGFIIAKLMTVYKLKTFIFNKLQDNGLPYDITLKQFYDRCSHHIIINFEVVNLTQKRIDFLNKITSPNMPVWAAILAASSLPSLHRSFQVQRHWEKLSGSNLKTNEMLSFFKDSQIMKRKYTLYSSSILISSIPMELITNSTFINKFKQLNSENNQNNQKIQIQSLKDLKNIGFVFSHVQPSNLLHMKVKKKYFNLSFNVMLLLKKMLNFKQGIIATTSDSKHKKVHYNRSYQVSYDPISSLKRLILNNVTVRILQTLIQSNDNLVMKWYFDKLIRLPIKIGTLQFNGAVDQKVLAKHNIKAPSQKAKDTLVRSYQITKSFIENIENRFIHNKFLYQNRSNSKPERFQVKLRAEFIGKTNPKTGSTQSFIKVTFLNHSKWNQNMYNNYVIEYIAQIQKDYQRCQNSEIVWKISEGPQLYIRFYYLHYQPNNFDQDYFTSKNSIIMLTECILDFQDMISKSRRNSYDYTFYFGINQKQEKIKQEEREYVKIKACKLNGIKVNPTEQLPKLKIQHHEKKQQKIRQKYIKRSQYRFALPPVQ